MMTGNCVHFDGDRAQSCSVTSRKFFRKDESAALWRLEKFAVFRRREKI